MKHYVRKTPPVDVARNKAIIRLSKEGKSAAEVAEALRLPSRNIVIGVLDRERSKRSLMRSILLTPLGKPLPKKQEPHGCRWIDGEVGKPGWRYCQKPIVGHDVCSKHFPVMFRPKEPMAKVAEAAD